MRIEEAGSYLIILGCFWNNHHAYIVCAIASVEARKMMGPRDSVVIHTQSRTCLPEKLLSLTS